MNKLLTLAILSLFSVQLLAVLPTRGIAYRDSVYRQIIKEGGSQIDCYLSYPQDKSQVIRYYADNARELDKLDKFIQGVLGESSSIYINKISITGYCSIEGTYAYNMQLSKERVKGFIDFVNKEYNLSTYPVEVDWKGEDWEVLRQLIDKSAIPERFEMTQIIDKVYDIDEREMRLKILNGGQAYRKIYDDFFPLLRRVNVLVEYDVRQIIKDNQYLADEDDELGAKIDSLLRQKKENFKGKKKVSHKKENKGKKELQHFPIVIKTNVMSWAGLTPDLKLKTFMPNLAAEVYLTNNWSVTGSATYSYLNSSKDKQFRGVSGYSIEPRYWIDNFIETPWSNNTTKKYNRLYIGGYAQYGDFDYCVDVSKTRRTDNYTGTYAQAGLSIGYHVQITPVWGVDLGLRGGYQYSQTKVYEIESPQYFFKEKLSEDKIKIDGLNLNVTYKFK
jgi:hypothetical protein